MAEFIFQLIPVAPLTFLHWMLAISVTLFLLDVFIQTDIFVILSLLLFSLYATLLVDVHCSLPVQWDLLVFLIFIALAFAFYCLVWHKLLSPFLCKLFLSKASQESFETAAGQKAVFRLIEHQFFVEWNGELWPADSSCALSSFSDREEVVIESLDGGKLFIKKI